MEIISAAVGLFVFVVWLAFGFGGLAGVFMLCQKLAPDNHFNSPAWRWMIFWGVYMSSMFGWIIGYAMFGGWLLHVHVFGVAP